MTSAAALSDFALPLVNVKSGWIFNFVASSVTVFDVAKEIHTQYVLGQYGLSKSCLLC